MQQGVAIVESTCNESIHNRLCCVGCERSGDRTQLAQLATVADFYPCCLYLFAPVAEWLEYLLGQRKDRGSNPGLAICIVDRINLDMGR